MTTSTSFKAAEKALKDQGQLIKSGSAQHQVILEAGYGMKVDEAKAIVASYDKNANSFLHNDYKKAKAMLANLAAKPTVISKKAGWKRTIDYPMYGENNE